MIDNSKWQPYPDYRDSGVGWLGEIPSHWEITRLKFVAHIEMGQSPSSVDYNQNGIGLPFLQGNAEFSHRHPTPKYYCPTANKYAHIGDILLSVRAPVGAINIADQNYGIGRGLCAIRVAQQLLNRDYAWYLLPIVKTELDLEATGSTYDAVSADEVANLRWNLPSLPEQHAIAAFLDRETARIDALIDVKERLIALLEEKRAALISHVVTKGLDPDAPMKDSGIDWLGEIPAHWEVRRLKFLVSLVTSGSRDWAQYYSDEGALFLRIGTECVKHVERVRQVLRRRWMNYRLIKPESMRLQKGIYQCDVELLT
jgi:type I restriction enzyme S subunit